MSSSAEVVRVDGLTKSFGGTRALDGVSLEVREAEVHALLGQNGSGKSTLIKILSGYHHPDGGTVAIRGEPVRLPLSGPELQALGVTFVHQDLGLVPTMSVLENLRVNRYETGPGGRIRWGRERERARGMLRRFELEIDPDRPIAKLTQTERVIVAVIRALQDVEASGEAGLLVLDEPTSALPAGDVEILFAAIRRVTESGSGVLFVTHEIDEVFQIGDRATVLRDGRTVATVAPSELDHRALIKLIIGRDLGDLYPPAASHVAGSVMTIEGLTGTVAKQVSFGLRRGEILGLTGLIGAGHDELPYLIYGAQAASGGTISIDGEPLEALSPQDCTRAGIALLPNDRQRRSATPTATVKENVTLPDLRTFKHAGRLDHRRERTAVEAVLEQFDVRPRDPDRPLLKLSGGNQQKAVLARWLRLQPRVLLLHEPTQGVDVGARRGIFQILRDAVADGASIIYASAEYEDLANVCDRVLAFRRGRLVSELEGDRLRHDEIVSHCYASAGEAVAS